MKKIYLGSDHGGFEKKEHLKSHLKKTGYEVVDLGTDSSASVDYPIYARAVAERVQNEPEARGILLCRNGAGVCMAANKFSGIRAATAWDVRVAETARSDDDVNILCLPADYIDPDKAQAVVTAFLTTEFAAKERYRRRLQQVKEIEENN